MAKMTKTTFKTFVEKELKTVDGYEFDLTLPDGTVKRMGVYRNEVDKRWDIIDVDTGLSVCSSVTRKDAIARAESDPMVEKVADFVAKPKYETLKKRLADAIKPAEKPKANGPVIEAVASPETGGKLVKVKDETKPKATKSAKPKAPKPPAKPKQVEAAAEVSLETMRKWCKSRPNTVATQVREDCPIWVEGETKPYQAELKELGFRWAPRRKGWYFGEKERQAKANR